MVKRDYLKNSIYSIKALSKNLILYTPDLIFFISAFILTYLFLNFNNLASIFGGQLAQFDTQIKNIVTTGSLLSRLVISLLVLLALNVLIGLGTITLRFTMISNLVQGKKVNFLNGYKDSGKYLFPLVWLKLSLFVLYLVPILILLLIGVIFQPLLLICIFLIVLIIIALKISLLFIYPVLFLKKIFNPIKVIKEAVSYFKNNKLHTFAVAVITAVIGLIISGIFTLVPLMWGSLSVFSLTAISSIIYLIIKTLADITVNLWSSIFTFKNY